MGACRGGEEQALTPLMESEKNLYMGGFFLYVGDFCLLMGAFSLCGGSKKLISISYYRGPFFGCAPTPPPPLRKKSAGVYVYNC